jgi:chitinase
MKKSSVQQKPPATEPQRRLSPWRVMLAILILVGLGVGSTFGWQHWKSEQSMASSKPWFASYVDVTATPTFAFEQLGAAANRSAILSFIVASPSSGCTPSWGGAYTMEQAGSTLDLDRRIARLQQQDGNVAVSFGGLKNSELALTCSNVNELSRAYQSVVDRYNLDTIDLDLEFAGLTDTSAGDRRAEAIAKLQAERRARGKKLAVWVTLPVTPQGLSEAGTDAVARLLAKNVDLAGVNIMTMDYGQSKPGDQTMAAASQSALVQTHRQLGVLYQRAGTPLNDATLWAKLGATPMIGQNDEAQEVFTPGDAKSFNEFAHARGIGRMSMWSANRDVPCGSNYVDVKIVSDSCSGVKQESGAFAAILGANFSGNMSDSAGLVTEAVPTSTTQTADDPAVSPYQIWSSTGAYLQGTKVVWHHNVYQAKWWTEGDMPDSPVLQAWETPWELVGPVLPGEKPVHQATVPAGTYPEWSGTATYDTNQRVLFEAIPYQAKWWTLGDSPAAASSNPDTSPWVPLTQAQIDAVLRAKD